VCTMLGLILLKPDTMNSAHVVLIRLKVTGACNYMDKVCVGEQYCTDLFPFILLTSDFWHLKTIRIWNQVYPE
jgi:hypothetical protein